MIKLFNIFAFKEMDLAVYGFSKNLQEN